MCGRRSEDVLEDVVKTSVFLEDVETYRRINIQLHSYLVVTSSRKTFVFTTSSGTSSERLPHIFQENMRFQYTSYELLLGKAKVCCTLAKRLP